MEDLEGKNLRDGVTPRRDGRLPLGGIVQADQGKSGGGRSLHAGVQGGGIFRPGRKKPPPSRAAVSA